jgi:hypothetical protein
MSNLACHLLIYARRRVPLHVRTGRLGTGARALALLSLLSFGVPPSSAASAAPAASPPKMPVIRKVTALEYIDSSSFENASPVWYEEATDGSILVYLHYDHERDSPNRAAGHLHILLHAKPGSKLTLEFRNLDNVWNSVRASVGRSIRTLTISENGRDWTSVSVEKLPDDRIRLHVEMPGPRLYIARIEPYRVSDLENLLASIRTDPLVEITPIGRTVQGRELEIVRIGNPEAPYRVFIRARAHAFETAGNWVSQGLVKRLLRGDAEAKAFLERYCLYLMPMANKDGVALGRTRFNLQGKDLNRDWGEPANKELAPENYALEQWLERMIAADRKPHLAMELHNDGGGRLHISRPPVPNLARHLERMAIFETLLRRHTWFTEGSTNPAFRNSGTLGEGWLERYDIDALVHEFNSNWIAGLKDYPTGGHWETYGGNLATVLHEYFEAVKP